MTTVRERERERKKARRFFGGLSRDERGELGDQLVLGTFDWSEWMTTKPSSAFLRALDDERTEWEIGSVPIANLTRGQAAAMQAQAEVGRLFMEDDEDEGEIHGARPGPAKRGPARSQIPSGTPVRRVPPGGATGALPFDWPNPSMSVVSNPDRQANRSLARDVEELVREAEGHGCRVTSGRHWKVYCPGGLVVASKTPSDWRALKKIRSDLRRAGVPMANSRQPNRGSKKLQRPKLVDARKMASEYPETFQLPSKKAVAALRVGDFAKVATEGERFWVRVDKRKGSKFEGIVDNDLVVTDRHGLRLGDRIEFESKHLYDAASKDQMLRAHASRLAANPLDPRKHPRRRSDDLPALDHRIGRLRDHLESIEDILDRRRPSASERRALEEDRRRFQSEIRALVDKTSAIERAIETEGDLIEPPPPSLWRTRTRNPFVGQPDPGIRTDLEIFTASQLAELPTLATGHEDDLKFETSINRWWLDRIGPESGATHRITVEELDRDDGRWWPVHHYAAY